MMISPYTNAAAALLLSLSAGCTLAESGEAWEYSMVMEVAGMQMPLPVAKVCVRPEEGDTPPVDSNCELKEREVDGDTTRFRIVCAAPEPGELQGSLTRKGDRVEGRYTMTQEGESMTIKANGRKFGECDPSQPMQTF